jgi:hypothetical protein
MAFMKSPASVPENIFPPFVFFGSLAAIVTSSASVEA